MPKGIVQKSWYCRALAMEMVTQALAWVTTLAVTPGLVCREWLPTPLIGSPRLGVVGTLVIFVYIEFAKREQDHKLN